MRDLWLARAAGVAMTEERRAELEAEARRRLAQQISDEQKSALCDYVLTNGGPLTELEWQVDQLWPILKAASPRMTSENVDGHGVTTWRQTEERMARYNRIVSRHTSAI